MKSMKKVAG
ncbi:hypothetical protein AVEN_212784-1, partial [Araneus ventricosus]